jgi:hypothetical protein
VPSEDVYAALRVLSRLAPWNDVVVNLQSANLRNAELRFMRKVRVRLGGADLTDASLPEDWEALIHQPHR